MPVLQALSPHQTPVNWQLLSTSIKELVELFRELRVEIDVYAPYFRTKGTPRNYEDIVRANEMGAIFLCTFPGLTRRFWDEQRRGWYEVLLTPAIVVLDSALTN
jgi:hypothetical protein